MEARPSIETDVLGMLDIEADGEGRFAGRNLANEQGIVHAGQSMGQMIVAASRTIPDKRVKSIHAVMARVARADQANELVVEVVHSGRSMATVSVDLKQEGKVCSRSLILLSAEEPDLIKHSAPMPKVIPPEECVDYPFSQHMIPGELRVPAGTKLTDPSRVGEPQFNIWFRGPDAPADPAIQRALLVPPTVMFLIGVSIRLHQDVAAAYAKQTIDAGVISHTMWFGDVAAADGWLLVAQESASAGGGLAFGRGHIFGRDGSIVASFSQECLVRPMRNWNWREGRPR